MSSEIRKRESTLLAIDVKEIPKVEHDWYADGEEGEGSNILGGNDTAEGDTSQEQPLPPLPAECDVSMLVESDVAVDTESHSKYQCRIEEDESSLSNVSIVKEDQPSCQNTGWKRVARFLHDQEDRGHCKRP